MHTVRLHLKTTEYDEAVIDRRFHAVNHIHNVLVKQARRLLRKLSHDKKYQSLRIEYITLLKKDELSGDELSHKKLLSKEMSSIRIAIGLTEYGLQSYIKVCAKQYRKLLSSQQVQKEATRVYRGVEKVLFSDGKEIHFRRYTDASTICGKTNTNGIKFDRATLSIEWMGLRINCQWPKSQPTACYVPEALDDDISYCEVERKMFPNGWHYYVIVYLKGEPPKKITDVGSSTSGIDIGTSTMASASDTKVMLNELAPRCAVYNSKIVKLQRHMDISKRMSNPNKYREDGTIDKANHDRWKFSKTYIKNRRKLKSLFRQKAAYTKQSHEEMANALLADSLYFVVEDMSFKGLQRKAKNTERSDKVSDIKQKDGTIKQIRKYRRKKRFGRSLGNRAPAEFIAILERKAKLYGGDLVKVNTKAFRASQYDHTTDEYIKYSLKDRDKYIGGHHVQRDLYSAFLLKNTNGTLDKPDRGKCIYGFENLVKLQNELINRLMTEGVTMKHCFGF